MKLIGIVGRAYYNKDNQEIIQLNEYVRKALTLYDDVVSIVILPTNDSFYCNLDMGEDKIDNNDKKKLDYVLDMCDGFIVPGGTNWYKFDEYVIEYAIREDKPLLAICLGFQCLCSMYAVSRDKFDMTKKLGNDSHYGNPRKYIHSNSVLDNTLLKKILNKDNFLVNSVHHDYIDFGMNDLVVSSYSEDGIIESVEIPNKKFILGVQWHPEYLMDDDSVKIFNYFIDSIKK